MNWTSIEQVAGKWASANEKPSGKAMSAMAHFFDAGLHKQYITDPVHMAWKLDRWIEVGSLEETLRFTTDGRVELTRDGKTKTIKS